MALDKTELGDKLKQVKEDHKSRISNGDNIDNSADIFFQDIADAIVDHIDDKAVIKGGIIVEDSGGNQIGRTRQSNAGQID